MSNFDCRSKNVMSDGPDEDAGLPRNFAVACGGDRVRISGLFLSVCDVADWKVFDARFQEILPQVYI